MKPLVPYPVECHLRLLEHPVRKQAEGEICVQLNEEISLDTKLLDEYCFTTANELSHDLVSVIGLVKYADRSVKRIHSEGWGRRLRLDIPVLDLTLWTSQPLVAALKDCLDYLTGDDWHFKFRQRKSHPVVSGQNHVVSAPDTARIFVPYSHGLDSYAQLRLLEAREPEAEIICVFTDSKPNAKTWKQFCKSRPKGGVRAVQVPVVVDEPHHAEPTFRTRPFLYYTLSAYGAIRTRSLRVLIPENGQGSLGGSLVPIGNENQHRSCHPGFTARLTKFIHAISGVNVGFEHPAIYQTKGQVFRNLRNIDANVDTWLAEHRSCSHDQRHAHRFGERVHCGICGNCLLRRVSSHHALECDTTPYKFANLAVPSLAQALQSGDELPREMKAFQDLAANSIRSMQRMATLADTPDAATVWTEAANLSRPLGEEVQHSHTQLMEFLMQHKLEWNNFLSLCGSDSLIAKIARG